MGPNFTQMTDFQNQIKVCHEASDLSLLLSILFGTNLKFIDSILALPYCRNPVVSVINLINLSRRKLRL